MHVQAVYFHLHETIHRNKSQLPRKSRLGDLPCVTFPSWIFGSSVICHKPIVSRKLNCLINALFACKLSKRQWQGTVFCTLMSFITLHEAFQRLIDFIVWFKLQISISYILSLQCLDVSCVSKNRDALRCQ